MSFADWVSESQQRFRTAPPATAARQSAREFYAGLRARLADVTPGTTPPVYTSTLAGERLHWFVETPKDRKRARSALSERPVLEWLMEPVGDDTVFWDVGAYHGHYAVTAAAKGATTVAFDPVLENQKRLRRNAALNAVELDRRAVALSNRSTMRLFGGGGPNSEQRISDDGEQVIETRRGDDLDPAPAVVKVDVEGHETAVLDGMAAHLNGVERVAVEVHEGVDQTDVADRLRDAGLRVVELDTSRTQTYLGGERR